MQQTTYPERYEHHGHKVMASNSLGRDFVVGDIHGCYADLMGKLNEVCFDPDIDRLFALGDLNDRGPDSLKCLLLLKEKWFFSVLGNHEQMMMDALIYNERVEYWRKYGGDWYWHLSDFRTDELAFLIENYVSKLPHSITIKTAESSVGILHANPPQHWSDLQTGAADYTEIIWGRSKINNMDAAVIPGVDTIYVGHSADKTVRQLGNVNYIDTGAVYDFGMLTMVEI